MLNTPKCKMKPTLLPGLSCDEVAGQYVRGVWRLYEVARSRVGQHRQEVAVPCTLHHLLHLHNKKNRTKLNVRHTNKTE